MYLNNKNKLLELFTTIMNVDSKNSLTLRCTLTLDQDPLKTHEKKNGKILKWTFTRLTCSYKGKDIKR